MKNPSIILLDEATSALDNASEGIVQQALDELMKGRTTIVVAHRLSTIRRSNVIMVMHRGRLVEQGTHEELLALDHGTYRSLVVSQMSPQELSDFQRNFALKPDMILSQSGFMNL